MKLYEKLLEIQKHVSGLKKDSKAFGYEYVSGAKVLEHIKPKMNELGLILKQEIVRFSNKRMDYVTGINKELPNGKPKSEILSKVTMRFTWIDCETGDKDVNEFGANGQNDWDKGIGSALTYAERYFLLKYFHISTDEDDIDNPNRKPDEGNQQAPPKNDSKPPQNNSGAIADTRAWLSDVAFDKAIERIKAGEKDLYAKIDAEFRIKKSHRDEFTKLV